MKRLFAFGCSFTNYAWPSWADMLGNNFDYYENWAWPGLGNRGIAERVAECYARNKFTKEDTVIIQWSSHIRHDWFKTNTPDNRGWQTQGSIFNYLNEDIFDRKWIDTFWDERAYFVHSMNAILLTQGILNSSGCKWKMTTIADIEKLGADYPESKESHGEVIGSITDIWKENEELSIYKKSIFEDNSDKWITPLGLHAWNNIDTSYKFRDKKYPSKWIDYHPSIDQHKEWLYNNLIPSLGLSQIVPDQTKKWIDNINNIYENSRYDFDTFCGNINNNLKDWKTSYRGF